ncbi:MAG TPA: hypothetical protein VGS12_05700 [Caulobacteraceae bacterium]|nr:hypothetical protein [Caulobacteraceae bacterium]
MTARVPALAAAPVPVRRGRQQPNLTLWIPLTPLALLLAPLALLVVSLALAILAPRVHPIRSALALGALILAASGTLIDIQTRRARIHLRIL